MVEGKVQIEDEVIHVIVNTCYDFTSLLKQLTVTQTEQSLQLNFSRSDERSIPPSVDKQAQTKNRINKTVFPGGRNFK